MVYHSQCGTSIGIDMCEYRYLVGIGIRIGHGIGVHASTCRYLLSPVLIAFTSALLPVFYLISIIQSIKDHTNVEARVESDKGTVGSEAEDHDDPMNEDGDNVEDNDNDEGRDTEAALTPTELDRASQRHS